MKPRLERQGKFENWLIKRGAELLGATNEWEVIRFRTVNGVSVIYTNKRGTFTFTGESDAAYTAYKGNKAWKIIDRKRHSLRLKKNRLSARDGRHCLCCLKVLTAEELTIEHLLSFSHGGNDNDNNLGLACTDCQNLLGNLPVVQKIEVIIQRRKDLGVIFKEVK